MKFILLLVGWCILFSLSWPLAVMVLILAPVVWLAVLPFRLVGICIGALLALIKTILFLPARFLGYRAV